MGKAASGILTRTLTSVDDAPFEAALTTGGAQPILRALRMERHLATTETGSG